MSKDNENSSWLSGTCAECGYPVVVTQPDSDRFPSADYWWYCSNPKCVHHSLGKHTGDMEKPSWVEGVIAEVAPEEEEIPLLGGSSCSKIELEKLFGPLDNKDYKLKNPFKVFYLVSERGLLKSATLFTWKEIRRAWRNFHDGTWAAPGGASMEMQLIALLMGNSGMFEE